jgi:hypothetical protein
VSGLPADIRQWLLTVLMSELYDACDRALADGVPPEKLAANLAARLAALQADRSDAATHCPEWKSPAQESTPAGSDG